MAVTRGALALLVFAVGGFVGGAGGCSSVTEPLRHVEPMDRKLEELGGHVHAIETDVLSMDARLVGLDQRLSGLASIDSGVTRTSASVEGLHGVFPRLDAIEARLQHVATNDAVERVQGRLGEQLAALGETKAELASMNAKLAQAVTELGTVVSELRTANRELGDVSGVARRADEGTREVLGWKALALAALGLVLGLHVALHWRLRVAVAGGRASPGT